MIRNTLLGLVSAVALISSANAADMYVPSAPAAGGYKDGPAPVSSWAGPYVGINGGYAWSNDSRVYCGGIDFCDSSAGGSSKSFASSGWFGGGQIGYNWQPVGQGGYKDGAALSNFVFGIEADIQGADITGSGTLSSSTATATATDSLDWFGTVRARVGYTVGAALLYGTGGVAFGGVQDKLAVTAHPTVQHDATATGYAVGAGLEYAFNPAWSAKVEYQYINLGTDSLVNDGVTADFNHEYNTVRLGLNYHFDRGYEPLK